MEVSPATLYEPASHLWRYYADAAKELKELPRRNGRLKRLLADAELEQGTAA